MAEGKTKRDATRCLKRHLAREVFFLLWNPAYEDLGPGFLNPSGSAGLPADRLGRPRRLARQDPRIERGLDHDEEFIATYRAWLNEHLAA